VISSLVKMTTNRRKVPSVLIETILPIRFEHSLAPCDFDIEQLPKSHEHQIEDYRSLMDDNSP
jgi:hypothetical protein